MYYVHVCVVICVYLHVWVCSVWVCVCGKAKQIYCNKITSKITPDYVKKKKKDYICWDQWLSNMFFVNENHKRSLFKM